MPASASSIRKKLLFAALYFSEGAPIGFLWWALPTRLESSHIPLDQITGLSAMLVLPWTFKFLWAPLVDALQSPRWTLRHWIVTCQILMGITLVPLLWLDLHSDLDILKWMLLAHAIFAATQDVAIDALCISMTEHSERGQYNGWMQAGMLAGRSLLGGGALILFSRFGNDFVVGALLLATTFSMVLLFLIPEVKHALVVSESETLGESFRQMQHSLKDAFSHKTMWLGMLFALTGGAAFEALGAVQGPTLKKLGYTEETVGWIFAVPYVLCMAFGAVTGGYLADRFGHRRFVVFAVLFLATTVGTAGGILSAETPAPDLLSVMVCIAGLGIGLLTASSYAMFMDLTQPHIAGTQFSAFMGATNGCEAWAAKAIGVLPLSQFTGKSLSVSLWLLCGVSVLSVVLVPWLKRDRLAKTS